MHRNNTRRHPRVALSLAVQLAFDSLEELVHGRTVDLSTGGMFLHTATVRPPGTLIHFSFRLSDGTPLLEGTGRVVRTVLPPDGKQPAGLAVEFETLDDASRHLLDRVLAKPG